MEPRDQDLYEEYQRGELFLRAGQPAEAARILQPVVEAAPESTAALELHARALFGSAQLARAEAALRELVERRPDDGWAQFALARTLERLGRTEEAATHRRLADALGFTES
ncbi:MAG: tetratricopeptide repeat protein [Actinobacteria bacterium]|nr:tetratricopeptide repeat protein [Actinomycetota bacterium]MCA1720627.1 tetratricopeptide repeat protein [Actinomycetota bacterium]